MTRKRSIIIVAVFLIITLLSTILIYEDKNIELNEYEILNEKLTKEFDGFRIAHISDFHNAEFASDKLVAMLEDSDPDIIAITGDIIDAKRTDIDISFAFVEKVLKIAPCYYVTGNHEARSGSEYVILKDKMEKAGVIILENSNLTLELKGSSIEIAGLEDPTFSVIGTTEMEAEEVADELSRIKISDDKFTLLLSHKPEFFDIYVENDIDLVLSGHTHGGQFIIPFVGGVIAPGQGFFPEYDSGIFHKESTTMIISRGIGNSVIPLRINDRPEIILIELKSQV